jgi:dephospho-CoA kinase
MKVIGLAGRPGSGKSVVGRALAERAGVEWVDLDPVAWATYAPGTQAFDRLVERFGRAIVSDGGVIDRERLALVAFRDADARRALEAIVHPAVAERLRVILSDERRRGTRVLLVEGALLSTSPYVDRAAFDTVVWLDASANTRRSRLRAAGRPEHIGRGDDIAPDASAVVVGADGSIAEVAERVWAVVEAA